MAVNLANLKPIAASHVYAVGDIHGCLDLLVDIERQIYRDIEAVGATTPVICYLGDYIDKGPNSAAVIEHLVKANDDSRAERIFLRGNHEDRMLDFLLDPRKHGPQWMRFGGDTALASYGIVVPENVDWQIVRDELQQQLPTTHLAFLKSLEIAIRWRKLLFVHAGLNPQKPLHAQDERDVLWIREPFLSSHRNWGVRVVHGHVPVKHPEFYPDRIAIDTGAALTGVLTCLALDNTGARLLQTSPSSYEDDSLGGREDPAISP